MKILLPLLVLVSVACLVAPAAQAARPCYAEVLYLDKPYGHTYEYRCGGFRLHAGQVVRVPVRRYGTSYFQITLARVMHVGSTRLYPGFLRAVAGV